MPTLFIYLFCILAMEKRNDFRSANFYSWYSDDGKEDFFLSAFSPLVTTTICLFIHDIVYLIHF